jgi:hypothetical protein
MLGPVAKMAKIIFSRVSCQASHRRVPSLYRTEQQTGWSKVGIMVLGSHFNTEMWLVGLSVGGDPGFEDCAVIAAAMHARRISMPEGTFAHPNKLTTLTLTLT